MLSRTGEYALRAVIQLAQHVEDWPIPGNEIASRAGIPSRYLSAVLSELVRRGVLESTRGKRGGFRMVKTPQKTRLIEILAPFEQFDKRRCPFGNVECSDARPCIAHHEWKQVVATEQQFLKSTTVQDVATRRTPKRKKRKRARGS